MKQILYVSLLIFALLSTTACSTDSHSNDITSYEDTKPVVYNTANSELPSNQINTIAIDKQDVKWIGTGNGLVRLTNSAWKNFNAENSPLPSSVIQALAVEDNGTLWVGTDKGLATYNGISWSVYDLTNSMITNNSIMCITHDATRKITWVATEKELIRINATNAWERFDTLEEEIILSMAVGQDGELWLGTFYPFGFRARLTKFHNNQWSTNHLDQMGYPSAFPYSIAVDNHNSIVALLTGTVAKSVIRLKNGQWEEVPRPEDATGLRSMLIEGDKIWVGGNTLSLFGNTQNPCLAIPGGGSNILSMAIDSKHRKWLGTVDGGLVMY